MHETTVKIVKQADADTLGSKLLVDLLKDKNQSEASDTDYKLLQEKVSTAMISCFEIWPICVYTQTEQSEMHNILKDQITISEGIEVAQPKLPCTYFHIRFIGSKFPPELRNSRYGYIFRARPGQTVGYLMVELK